MSLGAQPGIHPDADMLNAFVEQALPDTERARVMAHMAGCARCREVVFLARSAAGREIAPAPAAMLEPKQGWAAGFGKWRIALIPAGAMAMIALSWFLYAPMRSRQIAKLTPPPVPSASKAIPAPHVEQQTGSSETSRQVSGTFAVEKAKPAGDPQRPPTKAIAREPERLRVEQLPLDAASISPPPMDQGAPAESAEGAIHLDARSASLARYAASSQPAPAIAVKLPAPAPPPSFGTVSGTALSADSKSVVRTSEIAPQALHGVSVVRLARQVRVPSGLDVVSSALLLNRVVAVDAAGGVFLSQDGGKHWDPVKAQWNGRAIEVQAPPRGLFGPLPAANAKALNLAVEARPSPPPPPPGDANGAPNAANSDPKLKAGPPELLVEFRLLTDRRKVWLSADGKVWREQ